MSDAGPDYARPHRSAEPGPARVADPQRLLVCVSASPHSAQLIRAAHALAARLHADWIAVHVETPAALRSNAASRARVAEHFRSAQELGAETVTLSGRNATQIALDYARVRRATKIVVGKPTHARIWDRIRASFVEEVVRASADLDVYVVTAESNPSEPAPRVAPPRTPTPAIAFVAASSSALLATAVSWSVFGPKQLADVVMIYLLGIVLVSMRFGYAPSLLAAVLSIFCFDFFFVPPLFTLVVRDWSHIVTFAVMFMVAWVISGLTQRVRAQAEAAGLREQRTASLYALSRDLAAADQVEDIDRIAARHVSEALAMDAALLMPHVGGASVRSLLLCGVSASIEAHEASVAEWVWENERPAGFETEVMPQSAALYLPLLASRGKVGVLRVCPAQGARALNAETRRHLTAFANQIASALERTELGRLAQWAQVQMETEQMRSSLLSSVSHDLRTPLAVMTGAASTLLEDAVDAVTRRELTESILQEAQRLNRLVRNLLDMTRLEAGAVRVKKEWQPLEEVVGSALNRMEDALAGRPVLTELAADLPLVPLDAVLIEQVLVNLLENAIKYTPRHSALEIRAARASEAGPAVEVIVADRGPGIAAGEESRIFDKFYRANGGQGGGVGLGLAICRGIVNAHGGVLDVRNRAGGGAQFRFQLPLNGPPPVLEAPEPIEN